MTQRNAYNKTTQYNGYSGQQFCFEKMTLEQPVIRLTFHKESIASLITWP